MSRQAITHLLLKDRELGQDALDVDEQSAAAVSVVRYARLAEDTTSGATPPEATSLIHAGQKRSGKSSHVGG